MQAQIPECSTSTFVRITTLKLVAIDASTLYELSGANGGALLSTDACQHSKCPSKIGASQINPNCENFYRRMFIGFFRIYPKTRSPNNIGDEPSNKKLDVYLRPQLPMLKY